MRAMLINTSNPPAHTEALGLLALVKASLGRGCTYRHAAKFAVRQYRVFKGLNPDILADALKAADEAGLTEANIAAATIGRLR